MRPAVEIQLFHAFQTGPFGSLQVFQQRSHRARNLRPFVKFQIFQTVFVELLQNQRSAGFRCEIFPGKQLYADAHSLFDKTGKRAEVQRLLTNQNFPRRKAAQFIDQFLGQFFRIFPGQRGRMQLSGGNIRKADAGLHAGNTERTDVIVARLVQHTAFQHGAGCNDADDIPFDQSLRKGGILHLFTDGNLISLGNQARNIAFVTVKRDTAHGCPLRLAAVAPRQCQFQLTGCEFGIVVEHFIEISEAEKQDGIRVLLLQIKILLHHGG